MEEDNTNQSPPGVPVTDSISLSIHKSYASVVTKGNSAGNTASLSLDAGKRYFISVLPNRIEPETGYALGGIPVGAGDSVATVTLQSQPIPTAQISVFAFVDHDPINNAFDEMEQGLGGCKVMLFDAAGQMMTDVFGNPLGTRYDAAGNMTHMGNGVITTLTRAEMLAGNNPYNLKVGEATVKYLPPGKYGVRLVPSVADDMGQTMEWIQTTTIEGTPTIDAWVKANEPTLFVEGFGTGFKHVTFGFVKVGPKQSIYQGQNLDVLPWLMNPPTGTGSITGQLRYNHFSRPPNTQGFFAGEPVSGGWIGLNDPLAQPEIDQQGLYAVPCDDEGNFKIANVPPGTYELVSWDKPLISLWGTNTITVLPGTTTTLGSVLCYRWFGTLEGRVFNDVDEDGFPDTQEAGISDQNINIRFRDGRIYQSTVTDPQGKYKLETVFPFFKWLVTEVDFIRYKPTGATMVIDNGGEVPLDNGWIVPSRNKLNPQPQFDADPLSPTFGQILMNPNTGNNLSRTETGPLLTQAMHLFLNQTNVIDWGKKDYEAGENGGISGVIFYDTTRAEDDPRYNAGEPWQPGIPRVQVVLYADANADGVIDDLDGDATVTLSDADNYPYGWKDGGEMGAEDRKRNNRGPVDVFHPGDALNIVYSDSWDDSSPTGSIQNIPVIHGTPAGQNADAFSTWNQIRPGVFDGGYAFGGIYANGMANSANESEGIPAGTYVVESVPPDGYEIVKEEDKNVLHGDTFKPSMLQLPPVPVGNMRVVPAELSLFPGEACPTAGQLRPLADRKQVVLADRQNAGCDFFFFTEVPKAARAFGFVNNDLGAEFNQASPNFGEKISPAWIPVSFRD